MYLTPLSAPRAVLIAALLACAIVPAARAGVTCQLLDAAGNPADDGGADAGPDVGGNANAIACGRNAKAAAAAATAFGWNTEAAIGSVAVGASAKATASQAVAVGSDSSATMPNAIAIGTWSNAGNWGSMALGASSRASGLFSTASGFSSIASGNNSLAIGGFWGTQNTNLVTERFTRATASNAIAFGAAAASLADDGSALGTDSQVRVGASRSVALGAGSVATQADTVSLGHSATDISGTGSAYGSSLERRIVHLAAGIDPTDAVNVAQLGAFASALGGGATFAGGVLGAPNYIIQSGSFSDVGAALSAIDTQLSAIKSRADLAVYYDDAGKTSVTLGGSSGPGTGGGPGGTQVAGVADGTAADHAVNKGQMEAGDAAAIGAAGNYTDTREAAIRTDMATADANVLSSAKAHADSGDAATLAAANGHTDNREAAIRADMATADANVLSSAKAHADSGDASTLQSARRYADDTASQAVASANRYTDSRFQAVDLQFEGLRREMDDRFTRQDRRIDRMGAMSSAMLNMAVNAAGPQSTGGRVSVGAGFQGSEKALSIGYSRRLGARGSFSLGGAFSGGEKSGGIGFGVDL